MVKEGVDFQPPFRLMDLDDVLVARGQSVILTCKVEAVESAESYEYKWFFNGSAISENDTRRQLLENGSLHIPKILNGWHSLEGGYQCFVSIKGRPGGLLSNSAKLKVASTLNTLVITLILILIRRLNVLFLMRKYVTKISIQKTFYAKQFLPQERCNSCEG